VQEDTRHWQHQYILIYFYVDDIYDCILSVLHPWYKLTYFSKVKWPQSWITTAESILWTEWETNYRPTQATLVDNSSASSSTIRLTIALSLSLSMLTSCKVSWGANKYFESLDDTVMKPRTLLMIGSVPSCKSGLTDSWHYDKTTHLCCCLIPPGTITITLTTGTATSDHTTTCSAETTHQHYKSGPQTYNIMTRQLTYTISLAPRLTTLWQDNSPTL